MSKFMLLLHEEEHDFSGMSAADMEAVVQEYMDWRKRLTENGKMIDGDKLRDGEARHLVMDGGELRVTDGPYAEVKEVLGGFFAVQATDYDEAVELASDCPHLKYGGRIEIRQVEELGD